MKSDEERLKNRLHSVIKGKAKKRGIPFNLDKDELFLLSQCGCYYCGEMGSSTLKYQGLELEYNWPDRLDSSKGYEPENVIPCCSFCNSLKGAMKPEHWFDFINSVVTEHADPFLEYAIEVPFPKVKKDPKRKSKRYFKGW